MCRNWTHVTNEILQAQAIVPCDELTAGVHELNSAYCRCNVCHQEIPNAPGWTLYMHQSFDRREVDQYFARKPKSS